MRLKINTMTGRRAAASLAFVFFLICGLEKPIQAAEKSLEAQNKQTIQALI